MKVLIILLLSFQSALWAQGLRTDELNSNHEYAPVDREEDWKLQSTTFKWHTIKNPNKVSKIKIKGYGDNEGEYSDYQLGESTRDLIGTLTITEINPITYSKRITEIKGLSFRVYSRGALARAGVRTNVQFSLYNVEGKTLDEIISEPYEGYKASIHAGILLNLNPNTSVLENRNGVVIRDTEQWIAWSGAGIGVELSQLTGQFYFRKKTGNVTKTIYNNNKPKKEISEKEVSIDNILQTEL